MKIEKLNLLRFDDKTKQKSLSIIRRPNLTNGQKDLYALIVDKLNGNEPIYFLEAKDIFIKKVCKQVYDGIPYCFNIYANRYVDDSGEVNFKGGYEPMTEDEVTKRVLLWLTSNIGALVLKGYLKLIPQIELDNPSAN